MRGARQGMVESEILATHASSPLSMPIDQSTPERGRFGRSAPVVPVVHNRKRNNLSGPPRVSQLGGRRLGRLVSRAGAGPQSGFAARGEIRLVQIPRCRLESRLVDGHRGVEC
jgi:hypothetical protein